ncbi:MAG: acyl-[acyl-carrier-protein] thioesterase [Bdellovibrio sp.]|nr:acyl-[acyl-carrier-protein] thioesterase [Bdellovibrio sp.]
MNTEFPRLWKENFRITSLLVNPLGRLGLFGALNLIQETAWMHAERVGFGMSDMEKHGLYWVLTRQTIPMKTWPKFNDEITIETWLRPPEGAFVARDFRIKNSAGEVLGTCSTSWLALDRNTGKILPSQNLRPWEQICLPDSAGLTTDKIPVEGEYEKLAKFRVRNSDLDINQHVNNAKYAQWILDAIPYDLHKSLKLNSYSVNFLAETHLGEKVEVEKSLLATSHDDAQGTSTYRGVRLSDGKILFTARLDWEKK